jgi:hypothetical protein
MDDLRARYPESQELARLSDETNVVVSEPLGDLPGVWNEVLESHVGIVRPGEDELRPLAPGDDAWSLDPCRRAIQRWLKCSGVLLRVRWRERRVLSLHKPPRRPQEASVSAKCQQLSLALSHIATRCGHTGSPWARDGVTAGVGHVTANACRPGRAIHLCEPGRGFFFDG